MAEATSPSPDRVPPDTGLLPRTYFKAPRVPLDLRALFLAFVGYLVYRGGSWILDKMFDPHQPVASFFDEVLGLLGGIPYIGRELERFLLRVFVGEVHATAAGGFWIDLVGGIWTIGVWGFFAQAIHRITSLRIARDEGLSLKESIKFSTKNFLTILYCPLIIGAAIGFFYGCNAAAGVVLSIPWVGQLLSIVLVPLAVISTLLILLIAIGGAVGLPLVGAAAAWERNGSLDAISRAFSYIFARPLQFFWNYFLIFMFTAVILIAGGHFESILAKSVDAGLLRDAPSMMIDTPPRDSQTFNDYSNDVKTTYDEMREVVSKDRAEREPRFALNIQAVGKAGWGDKLTILAFWIALNLIRFGTFAAALWWFFGATTSTYADLRADVDGTEEDEIYLEEEEEDFEALAKPEVPAPGSLPPASSPPPAPTSPTPPTA